MIAAIAWMAGATTARAEPREYDIVSSENGEGIAFVRHVVPATATTRAQSRTIFLNRHGATLRPGNNDSRLQTSSIVTKQTAIRGWSAADAEWAATVACMRQIWAPFAVTVTETDPGQTP